MKIASLEVIFHALQAANARFIVVGGLAVIAHGYVRMTQDLDLVLDLAPASIQDALGALESLGYRPLVPVSLRDFENPEKRKDWIEKRNMKVFNLVSDRYPEVPIDIFPHEPFAFEVEYAAADWREISPLVQVPIVSIPTLIAMKTEANRFQDQVDIEKLRKLFLARP